MKRLLRRFLNGQKGQALLIVLGLLAIGGLTIAVSLNYATTNLKGSQILREDMRGIYAATAGVELALWSLGQGEEPLTQLTENISGMAVTMSSDNVGTFTWYFGDLIEAGPPQVHVEYVDVSGSITYLGGDDYEYTITVTWQPGAPNNIKLEEVGARLPVGYTYNASSAALFPSNLSEDEPVETQDIHDAWMVNWELGPPAPNISEDETMTQIFYITGTGSTSGHYAFVKGLPDSIGMLGEIKGTRFKITAKANRPGDGSTTAEIVADVIIGDDGTINITSWLISN